MCFQIKATLLCKRAKKLHKSENVRAFVSFYLERWILQGYLAWITWMASVPRLFFRMARQKKRDALTGEPALIGTPKTSLLYFLPLFSSSECLFLTKWYC